MGLPTISALNQRKAVANRRLQQLHRAYDVFIEEWDCIRRQDIALRRELAAFVDKRKLKNILETIHSLNDKDI